MTSSDEKGALTQIYVGGGVEQIPIRNRAGEMVGTLCFCPTDAGIIVRSKEAFTRIIEIVKPLVHMDIHPDGTVSGENARLLHDVEQRLYEAFNYMLGGNFAEAFFGKVRPFAAVGGQFYCLSAVELVDKIINQRIQQMYTQKADGEDASYTDKKQEATK